MSKRIFDIAVSSIILLILMPFLSLICLLIYLEDGHKAGYLSLRRGYMGKLFHMFKFRSMVPDADKLQKELEDKNEKEGGLFKIKKDPRITKVGWFIRKFSIDELPQLFNVLRGEMSLVGPRPLPMKQFNSLDPRHHERLFAKPGITGMWQISGRSETTFERMIKWDLWYIKNRTFWLDIKILIKTIPAVLYGKGAY